MASLSFWLSTARAQEAKVQATLATNGTIWVGQKMTLVVNLLAPGYFNSAPTFDLPDPPGMILLPPTDHPIVSSKQIGDTSYTVQRLELSVFAAHGGAQTIPPFTVRFTFKRAPLDTNEIPAVVKTEAIPFTAALPPGAENLGGVISARDLKVTETWRPEPGKTAVKAGDAFTRTITFAAPDVPGMVFPPFPAGKVDGLGIYKKAEVQDQTERGTLSGERRDTITYICQRPGRYTIPAARLVWWDVDAKQLCTNDFPAYTFDVTANPALAAASGTTPGTADAGFAHRTKWWKIGGFVLALFLVFAIGWKTGLRPVAAGWLAAFRPVHLQPLNPSGSKPRRF